MEPTGKKYPGKSNKHLILAIAGLAILTLVIVYLSYSPYAEYLWFLPK